MSRRLAIVLCVSALAAGASARAVELPAPGEAVDIDRLLDSMSLEDKVGQLLMVGFGGTKVNAHSAFWVNKRRVGGVALFSRNIETFEQTARFTRELQGLADDHVPIFVALDQEGGNVVRVKDGALVLPSAMALGATRSPTLAYVAGQTLAVDLKLLGFNMNLAPVLDVNSNPDNPVIGIRSYGERADLVASLGAWYVRGLQENGVVAVAKHFPGHGDTHSDSHFAMPSIAADSNRLDQLELAPFKRSIGAGLDAVMTAHIAVPKVTGDAKLPATLSKVILQDTLRDKLGFQGIIMTDGLEMQGIVDQYGSGRAAVLAVLAGADMPMVLWTPQTKDEVYRALLEAVRGGEISVARLDASVRRILGVKVARGLFNRQLEKLPLVLKRKSGNVLHEQVAQRIAREAVTLVQNHGDLLPLRSVRYRKVLVIGPNGPFVDRLGSEPNVVTLKVPYVPSRERRKQDVEDAIVAARDSDLVVFAVVNRYHIDMARSIMKAVRHAPIAMISFASPYYLRDLPEVDAYICTYSYLDSAQSAAAEAVLGQQPMTGRLPISIPGLYAYGHRVEDRFAGTATVAGSVR